MAVTRPRVQDKDRGYRRVVRTIGKNAHGKAMQVGIVGDEELVMIANVQEFGGGNVPDRSWLRAWVDDNRSRIENDLRRIGERIAKGEDVSRDQLMGELGKRYVQEIKDRIHSGIAPELRPRTQQDKARRGAPMTPLVSETGRFIDAIGAYLDKVPV
jgi:hypothetical protein